MIRHGFMDHYKSPAHERSMYKNIPMTLRHHPFVKGMMAVGCRVRYRGPRVKSGMMGSRYHTLKRDATRFSIYPPSPIREYSRGPDNHWHGHTFWPWDRPAHRHLLDLEERLSVVRRLQDSARVLEDSKAEEQKILTELNRYNSVT